MFYVKSSLWKGHRGWPLMYSNYWKWYFKSNELEMNYRRFMFRLQPSITFSLISIVSVSISFSISFFISFSFSIVSVSIYFLIYVYLFLLLYCRRQQLITRDLDDDRNETWIKQGRIYGKPVAGGWAGAVMRKQLEIHQGRIHVNPVCDGWAGAVI